MAFKGRDHAVDLVKGFACLLMVLAHVKFPRVPRMSEITMASVLFFASTGMNLLTIVERRPGDEWRLAANGLFLFFAGFANNFVQGTLWMSDVFQSAGLAMIVMLALRRLFPRAWTWLFPLPFAIHWLNQNVFYWRTTDTGVASFFIAPGLFPLIPWLCFYLLGAHVKLGLEFLDPGGEVKREVATRRGEEANVGLNGGRRPPELSSESRRAKSENADPSRWSFFRIPLVSREDTHGREASALAPRVFRLRVDLLYRPVVIAGLALVLLALHVALFRYHFDKYWMSTDYFLIGCVLVAVVYAALRWYVALSKNPPLAEVRYWGANSLVFYILHTFVIRLLELFIPHGVKFFIAAVVTTALFVRPALVLQRWAALQNPWMVLTGGCLTAALVVAGEAWTFHNYYVRTFASFWLTFSFIACYPAWKNLSKRLRHKPEAHGRLEPVPAR